MSNLHDLTGGGGGGGVGGDDPSLRTCSWSHDHARGHMIMTHHIIQKTQMGSWISEWNDDVRERDTRALTG